MSPGEVSEGDSCDDGDGDGDGLSGSVTLPGGSDDGDGAGGQAGRQRDKKARTTPHVQESVTLTIPVRRWPTGTATFELTPKQDTVAEGPETVSVEGEATGFTVAPTELTLTDDDTVLDADHADGIAG